MRAAQRYNSPVNEYFTPRFQEMDLLPELGRVTCPCVVVVGALDPLVPPEAAAATAAACPPGTARLAILPDAAHDLLVDAPAALLREIRRVILDAGDDGQDPDRR